jgi:hypothetical protein
MSYFFRSEVFDTENVSEFARSEVFSEISQGSRTEEESA